ncbi:MAG: polyprenyl synthetase family protein [Gammaproteobacteria bacterium]
MDVLAIRALIAEDMEAVDRLIERSLHSDVALIDQLAHYIINSGGKRLRPLLALLAGRAAGHRGEDHVALAAIIEFIHTATLLHDDVVDASNMRRGRLTANLVWGNNASVLVGDFLYSRAFQMMVAIGNMRVMEILADATNTIAAGEVLQLTHCHDPDTTLERYMAIIHAKTGKLFEAAAQLGAVISGSDRAVEQALTAYGRHLGTAYQLIDDVLDYSASAAEIGKNIGDDLAEGKPTLPVLHALWHSQGEQASGLRQAVEKGGLEFIGQVQAAIESTGAIAYTASLAAEQARLAAAALHPLPTSQYKDALLALADFAVNRRS